MTASRADRIAARSGARHDRRRERMLDAIAECFAAQGYHTTSVDDVVARARSSKSAFYGCFPNKEMAFAALLEREGERVLQEVESAIVAEPEPRRRAGAGISTFVGACLRNADTARILLLESVGISPAIEARRRAWSARFARMVRQQAQATGGPRPPVDAEALSYAIVGAVNEVVVRLLETGGSDPAPAVASLEHLVRRALAP